jgi:hypothetical protein
VRNCSVYSFKRVGLSFSIFSPSSDWPLAANAQPRQKAGQVTGQCIEIGEKAEVAALYCTAIGACSHITLLGAE